MRIVPTNAATAQQAWEAYANAVAEHIKAELNHNMAVRIISEAKQESN